MSDKKRYETLKRLHDTQGNIAYMLAVFGDHLAKREGYQTHSEMDAVHFYLVTKHHWLPSTVRSMSFEDLEFVLSEELSGWTLPKAAIF
jgi:hypothetical protein